MDVKNCKKCRRLFNYIGGEPLCPQCKEELEKKFQEVKKYLYDNRNSTVMDLSENCDVSEGQIRQWIREERLELTSGIDAGVVCESCGNPITSGRFCEKCKVNMFNDLSAAGRKPEVHEQVNRQIIGHENKMRFIGR